MKPRVSVLLVGVAAVATAAYLIRRLQKGQELEEKRPVEDPAPRVRYEAGL